MHRIIFFILFFLSFSLSGSAQGDDSNDLLLALKKSKEDTSRINILYEIQNGYLDTNNDSALYYNKQSEALINKLNAETLTT